MRDLAAALAGQYALERELGRGGMGIVYLAREERLDRLVALKVLPPDLARDASLRERFLREARTAAQLSHPNIVPIHRADEAGGFAFFAMGYVDGETLGERLAARGRLGPQETVRILREVAWALAYAHARGVVHRDVKPDNVLLERGTGRVLVTDFGIARDQRASQLTEAGQLVGTVHYMSPEQIAGAALDGRSDLYALGVMGYLLLSGRHPFTAPGAPAILVAHATQPAPPLAEAAPDVPPALAAVVDRCLRKAPAERYATGEALAEALGAALEGVPLPADDTPVPRVLSPEDAERVWLRAAQLQMDAATAIRQKQPTMAAAANPTSGYRREDVEAAAAEVGIGREFVQLALAELPAQPRGANLTDAEDRHITQVLGTEERSLRVSRVIEAPAARVLAAVGQVMRGSPYRLTLLDTVGGHPLDGGVLSFKVPAFTDEMMVGSSVNMFLYRMTQIDLYQLSVALHPLPGRPERTEVIVTGDLRPGARKNVTVAKWTVGSVALGGGALGWAIGFAPKLLGLGALLAGVPAAVGIAAVGALGFWGYRAAYRSALRGSVEEIGAMLEAVSAGVRSQDVFGAPPPELPRRRGGSDVFGDGGATMSLLSSLAVALAVPAAAAAQSPVTEEVPSGTTALLQAVSAADERVVWASGHQGAVLRSLDGGRTWTRRPVPGADSLQFRDVHAASADEAWVLSAGPGAASRIYRTADGGATWTEQFRNADSTAFYDCLAFLDGRTAVAFSDASQGRTLILRTEDGGRTWTHRPAADVPAPLDGEGAFAASGGCVAARGPAHAWVATGGPGARLLASEDAGRTWTVRETPFVRGAAAGMTAVDFRDPRHGIGVGGRIDQMNADTASAAVAVTADGGRTWTLRPRPARPGALFGVAWVPGVPGTALAAGPGGLFLTTDEGGTWQTLDERAFWSVGAAGRTAWAVGPKGRIVRLAF